MTTRTQLGWLGGLIVLGLVLGFGCNPTLLPYFLSGGGEAMRDPQFQSLAPSKKDKVKREESKVVILAYSALDLRPEFVGLERDLSEKLAQQLKHGFEDNSEKVTLVPTSQVQAYKDRHPNWKTQDLREIGESFHADYLVYLELKSISFYKKGCFNMLYHGLADIGVTLVNVHDADTPEVNHDECHCEYPVGGREIPVEDLPAQKFRLDFLNDVATHLSWYFVPHALKDDISNK